MFVRNANVITNRPEKGQEQKRYDGIFFLVNGNMQLREREREKKDSRSPEVGSQVFFFL